MHAFIVLSTSCRKFSAFTAHAHVPPMRLSEQVRNSIALDVAARVPQRIIQQRYSCSANSVRRWGSEGAQAHPKFEDKPRSGRPRKLNSAQRSSIKRFAARGKTVPDIIALHNQGCDQPVSRSTVWRALKGGSKPCEWQRREEEEELRNQNETAAFSVLQAARPCSYQALGLQ